LWHGLVAMIKQRNRKCKGEVLSEVLQIFEQSHSWAAELAEEVMVSQTVS